MAVLVANRPIYCKFILQLAREGAILVCYI